MKTYGYTINLADGFSKAANYVSVSSAKAEASITRMTTAANTASTIAAKAGRGATGFSKAADNVSVSATRAGRGVSGFSQNAKRATATMHSAAASGNILSGVMRRIYTLGATYLGARAFGGIIKAGADIEQTRISFETMLRSAEVGKKTIAALDNFANTTPFTNDQVLQASKSLMAYKIGADDLVPTLTSLGNIAAGVGMDKMPQLILAFGQVKAATRLTGMELRQFTEAGVPLLDELSKTMGKSVPVIQKMVSEGQVGFSVVQEALANMSKEGGIFYNLMDKQSKSLAGRWSTFMGLIGLKARGFGEALSPGLKKLTELGVRVANSQRLTNYLSRAFTWLGNAVSASVPYLEWFGRLLWQGAEYMKAFAGWASRNRDMLMGFGKAIMWVGSMVLAYHTYIMIANAATAIWTIATRVANVATLLFTGGFKALNTVLMLNPIGLVVAGVVGLAGAFVWAYNKVDWFRGGVWGVWESINALGENLSRFMKETFKPFIDAWQAFQEGRYMDAAKLIGKGALSVASAPRRFIVEAVSGNMTAGVGDAYKKGYDKGLEADKINPLAWISNKLGLPGSTPDVAGAATAMSSDPAAGTAIGSPANSDVSQGIDSISSGGRSVRNVTVNINSLVNELTVMARDVREGADEVRKVVLEELLRAVGGAESTLANG